MENSQMHENSKDSEATLGIYETWGKGGKRATGSEISEMRMGYR